MSSRHRGVFVALVVVTLVAVLGLGVTATPTSDSQSVSGDLSVSEDISVSEADSISVSESAFISVAEPQPPLGGVLTDETELLIQDEELDEPGTYTYDVSDIDYVRVALEGAGGGGGAYAETETGGAGSGGSGGAVEAVLNVSAYDELAVVVGAGGGGGVDGSGGSGGDGRISGGTGGFDTAETAGTYAAGGGGGGSTTVLADDVPIMAADAGGGGGAWVDDAGNCCVNAGGGGGGAGGSGGSAGGDGDGSTGESATTADDRDILGGLGGSGGDADSSIQLAESGSEGNVWSSPEHVVIGISEAVGGGSPGGDGGADAGTDGGNAVATIEAVTAPTFEIESLQLPSQIDPGEAFELTAEITNTGELEGTQMVTLDAEGLGEDSTELSLSEGMTEQLNFELETQADDEGTYTITLTTEDDTESAELLVGDEPEPATFVLDTLDPTEATVSAGDSVELTVDVENTGGESGTQDIRLSVDGEEVETESLTLDGGASETVSFSTAATDRPAGEYSYTVATDDDELSGTLSVEADDSDDETEDPDDGGLLSGTILIALVVIGAVVAVGVALLSRRDDGDGIDEDTEDGDGDVKGVDEDTEEVDEDVEDGDGDVKGVDEDTEEIDEDSEDGGGDESDGDGTDEDEFDDTGFEWGPPGGGSS